MLTPYMCFTHPRIEPRRLLSGVVYEGEWLKDRPHRFGTAVFADGVMYEGLWGKDGAPHGWRAQ